MARATSSDASLKEPVTHFDLLNQKIETTNERIDSVKDVLNERIDGVKGKQATHSWIMGIGFTSILGLLLAIIAKLFTT